MAVRDRTHDGADRQAVEIVVDEDEHAEGKGGKRCADAGLDVLFRPAAKGGGAAGGVDERHDDAQQHKEKEDAGVVGDGGNKAVVEGDVKRADGGQSPRRTSRR